jgi:hypothetical protein
MTPQMPPPHLLTRTLASPACVSQIPVGSLADSDLAIGAPRSAVRTTRADQNLKAMNPPCKKAGLHSSK